MNALANVSRDLSEAGVRLILAHDIGEVRDLYRASGSRQLSDRLYPNVQAAVDAIQDGPADQVP